MYVRARNFGIILYVHDLFLYVHNSCTYSTSSNVPCTYTIRPICFIHVATNRNIVTVSNPLLFFVIYECYISIYVSGSSTLLTQIVRGQAATWVTGEASSGISLKSVWNQFIKILHSIMYLCTRCCMLPIKQETLGKPFLFPISVLGSFTCVYAMHGTNSFTVAQKSIWSQKLSFKLVVGKALQTRLLLLALDSLIITQNNF